jgi:Pyrimidine dimer DNA glycosylase.
MRLWHIDLLNVLPRRQLIGQNRECCLIEHEIIEKGKVNHLLVDFVNEDKVGLLCYHARLVTEIALRGYSVGDSTKGWIDKYSKYVNQTECRYKCLSSKFTERYLKQCLYNLQEKYDCGGITLEEWSLIQAKFGGLLK